MYFFTSQEMLRAKGIYNAIVLCVLLKSAVGRWSVGWCVGLLVVLAVGCMPLDLMLLLLTGFRCRGNWKAPESVGADWCVC